MRDFGSHFRGLVEAQLPKGARVLYPRGGTDLVYLSSWKLATGPGRPGKRSRMVRLIISREALKDYAAGTDITRSAADARLIAHFRARLAAFDPDHAAPPGVEPPSVTWSVDTLMLNGAYHDSVLTLDDPGRAMVRVSYMEALASPPSIAYAGSEYIAIERLEPAAYLDLYRSVGTAVRWDQRLKMPAPELEAMLAGDRLRIYVLRADGGAALGFCEFDWEAFPQIQLTNFGIIPAAQGRGLGPWLLSVALQEQWLANPTRVWLHTDTWDHPAARRVYERAGFKVYEVRDERADAL